MKGHSISAISLLTPKHILIRCFITAKHVLILLEMDFDESSFTSLLSFKLSYVVVHLLLILDFPKINIRMIAYTNSELSHLEIQSYLTSK